MTKENIITKDVAVSVNIDNAKRALKVAGFPTKGLTDTQIFDKVLGMLGLYGGSAVIKVSEESKQTKKYCFDSWRDSDMIKSQLSPEECDLLDDVLRNSQLIDNRPLDFDWSYNNYDCHTAFDFYSKDYYKIKTVDKYLSYEKYLIYILSVEEGYEDIDTLIEYTKELYKMLNK